ncbi:unnamed protein product [Amoebophrya sp. A120]|nr:unnamed protein product [Amoebophrya sp. A120]|eukprot:GSA120T00001712001.1
MSAVYTVRLISSETCFAGLNSHRHAEKWGQHALSNVRVVELAVLSSFSASPSASSRSTSTTRGGRSASSTSTTPTPTKKVCVGCRFLDTWEFHRQRRGMVGPDADEHGKITGSAESPDEVLYLSESFAESVQIPANARVTVRPVYNHETQNAKEVHVRALHANDFELVDANAEWICDNLRSQIGSLTGATTYFPIFIHGTAIKLQVLKVVAASTSSTTDEAAVAEQKIEESDGSSFVYVLTPETDLIIEARQQSRGNLHEDEEVKSFWLWVTFVAASTEEEASLEDSTTTSADLDTMNDGAPPGSTGKLELPPGRIYPRCLGLHPRLFRAIFDPTYTDFMMENPATGVKETHSMQRARLLRTTVMQKGAGSARGGASRHYSDSEYSSPANKLRGTTAASQQAQLSSLPKDQTLLWVEGEVFLCVLDRRLQSLRHCSVYGDARFAKGSFLVAEHDTRQLAVTVPSIRLTLQLPERFRGADKKEGFEQGVANEETMEVQNDLGLAIASGSSSIDIKICNLVDAAFSDFVMQENGAILQHGMQLWLRTKRSFEAQLEVARLRRAETACGEESGADADGVKNVDLSSFTELEEEEDCESLYNCDLSASSASEACSLAVKQVPDGSRADLDKNIKRLADDGAVTSASLLGSAGDPANVQPMAPPGQHEHENQVQVVVGDLDPWAAAHLDMTSLDWGFEDVSATAATGLGHDAEASPPERENEDDVSAELLFAPTKSVGQRYFYYPVRLEFQNIDASADMYTLLESYELGDHDMDVDIEFTPTESRSALLMTKAFAFPQRDFSRPGKTSALALEPPTCAAPSFHSETLLRSFCERANVEDAVTRLVLEAVELSLSRQSATKFGLPSHLRELPFFQRTLSAARSKVDSPAVRSGLLMSGARGAMQKDVLQHVLSDQNKNALWINCALLANSKVAYKTIGLLLQTVLLLAVQLSPAVVVFEELDALLLPENAGEQPAVENIASLRSQCLSDTLKDLLPVLRASCAEETALALDFSALHKQIVSAFELRTTSPDAASDALQEFYCAHQESALPLAHSLQFAATVTNREFKSLVTSSLALDSRVHLDNPGLRDRADILAAYLSQKQKESAPVAYSSDYMSDLANDLAARTDGSTVTDLLEIANFTMKTLLRSTYGDPSGSEEDLLSPSTPKLSAEAVLEEYRRSRPGHQASSSSSSSTGKAQPLQAESIFWEHVGGLQLQKSVLLDTLLLPTTFEPLFKRSAMKQRQGLLLVGPSGCGKTFLVHALSNRLRGFVRFFQVKGPELLSKYIGESEAGVRNVFEQARQASPSCIFFDEIEALCPVRGGETTGVTDRVVNQMLTYLDGVEARKQLFVIAASSRPDLVDPALLRPGRFDRKLYCGPPAGDTREWHAVIQTVIEAGKFGLDKEAREYCQDTLPAELAKISGFTPADVRALFSTAQLDAIHKKLEEARHQGDRAEEDDESQQDEARISRAMLEFAVASTKPSLSKNEVAQLDARFAQYQEKSPGRTDRGRGGEIAGRLQHVSKKVALA